MPSKNNDMISAYHWIFNAYSMDAIEITPNRQLTASSDKERNVWNALHVLYFEDKLPWRMITVEAIREKRRELDGIAGDSTGLGKMRERFRIKHNIDPDNDGNAVKLTPTPQTDPLFAITQKIREDIKQQLEYQVEAERTQLVERIHSAAIELADLRQAHSELKDNYIAATNEKQLLAEKLEQAKAERISATTTAQLAERALAEYKTSFEARMEKLLSSNSTAVAALAKSHQAAIDSMTDKHQEMLVEINKKYEEIRQAQDLYSAKLMQQLDDLRVENATLKAAQHASKALIAQFSDEFSGGLHNVGGELRTQAEVVRVLADDLKVSRDTILKTMSDGDIVLSAKLSEIVAELASQKLLYLELQERIQKIQIAKLSGQQGEGVVSE